jgi:FkbM family methyltransferase
MKLRTLGSRILSRTPLVYIPVRVKRGPAQGAHWTLLPFSHNWRNGGEADVEAGLKMLGQIKGAVCWDFGAHFGIHTVGMAIQAGPSGQVVSFEPDPGAFKRLTRHVKMNSLTNVRLFMAAASDRSGSGTMIISHGSGSAYSHFQYEDEEITGSTPTLAVEKLVPDELVNRGEIRPPNLIKIDVQGHGACAIGGSIESIRKMKPVVVFSNHSRWELAGARAQLEPLGYIPRNLAGAQVSWDFLNQETALLIAPT